MIIQATRLNTSKKDITILRLMAKRRDMPKLTIAQYAAGSWVISMLRFSTKLWQQHHRGLLSKAHLVALDGLPVSKADDGDYQIDEYTTADGQKWMLYPIFEEDCVNDISLFDEID